MKKFCHNFNGIAALLISMTIHVQAEHLDMIIFGNDSSEEVHNVEFANSSTSTGGLNESFRKLDGTDSEDSWISLTVKVEAGVHNYLTLKFWGSDTLESRQYLNLYYWRSFFGGLGQWALVGEGDRDEPEIVNWNKTVTYPDRFVYVTYWLPDDLIKADTIRFKIAGAKLPIYRVYTHTNSFFEPKDEEQGSAPEFTSSPLPDVQGQIDHLHEHLDLAVDRFLSWQYYGEEWDTWLANGWAPEKMTGAFNLHGKKDSTWTLDEWQDTWSARQTGHVGVQNVIETVARAFHAPWSKHYRDSTIIDRVVKGLDFLRIAQGSGGGYVELENSAGHWVGAPDRIEGLGSLMGFGMKGPPGAFLAIHNELMTDSLMNKVINEGDSLVTRHRAYLNLFTGIRDYLTRYDHRGHASNQDVVNILGAVLADQCVSMLEPSLAWQAETLQYWLDVCIGLEDGIYGGPWMSAKGTSMEAGGLADGGFESGYGEHNVEPLARLAFWTGKDRIRDYLALHNEALGRMRYLGYDNGLRPVLRREGWIGWRKTVLPGAESYGLEAAMSAVLYDDKITLRGIQLAAEHGAYYDIDYSKYWVHMTGNTNRMMRQVDYIEQALNMPATETRFPFEEGQPDYAWADEPAASVVIKQDGCDLKATLQWRHPLLDGTSHPDLAITNDKVRVHYSTPEYDLMATTAMHTTDGMYSLYIWQFGKYLVAMNASLDESYELELPVERPGSALDLISGQDINLSNNPILPPQTTLILEWPEELQVVSVDEQESSLPFSYDLKQNYPNPFNPHTTIVYSIAHPCKVRIDLFNVLGQKVRTLVDGYNIAGSHSFTLAANDLPSGIYFYSIQTDSYNQIRKMMLMK